MPVEQLRQPSQCALWPRDNGPGRRRFAPAQPVRWTSGFEGRRDESVTDVCLLAHEAGRGENTVAPFPLTAVLECLGGTNGRPIWRGAPGTGVG